MTYGNKDWVTIGSYNGLLPDGTKPLLKQCSYTIKGVMWLSLEDNFIRNVHEINPSYVFGDYASKIITTSSRCHGVTLCSQHSVNTLSAEQMADILQTTCVDKTVCLVSLGL